jgi:hypothetical protein
VTASYINEKYLRTKDHVNKLAMTQHEFPKNLLTSCMISLKTKDDDVFLVFDPSCFFLATLIAVLQRLSNAPMLTARCLSGRSRMPGSSENLRYKVQLHTRSRLDMVRYHVSMQPSQCCPVFHHAL